MIYYLTKQQVVRINLATIEKHGGNFMPPHNFFHEENLDYLLEVASGNVSLADCQTWFEENLVKKTH